MTKEWGPLDSLIGEWRGQGGLDSSYSHLRGQVWQTPYLEKVTMKPFGPVENGSQSLFGLDYKTVMWSDGEENPFHTDLGSRTYVIGEKTYLGQHARTVAYSVTVTVTVDGPDSWSYRENTSLRMDQFPDVFPIPTATPFTGCPERRR